MAQPSLRSRLIAFRAAYYRIHILRGLLLAGLWTLGVFVVFSLSEGLFWWDIPVRWLLWGIWIGGSLFFLLRWVLYPLLQYGFRLKGYLSDEEAARWIGRRLPEVQDKLLNALQLSRQLSTEENAAVALAIEERMRRLSVIPWEVTLPSKDLRRYAGFLLAFVGFSGLLWVVSPAIFRDGTVRFLRPNHTFARPLPYSLHVEGLKPLYRKGESLSLTFTLTGSKLPEELFVSTASGPLPLRRESPARYTLFLAQLSEKLLLRVETRGELLKEIPVEVIQPPFVRDLQVVCYYPSYTGMKPDTFHQPAVRVLKGSRLQIKFGVESERPYRLQSADFTLRPEKGDKWQIDLSALQPFTAALQIRETYFIDSLLLQVEVYPDYHPSVQLFSDWFNPASWEQGLRIRVADDFGFSRGGLWYRVAESVSPGRAQEKFSFKPLPIQTISAQEIHYTVAWQSLGVQPGDKVEYYVEVWDNDAVSGPKSSRSILYTLEPQQDADRQEVFAALQDSLLRELQRIQRELQAVRSQPDLSQNSRQATQLSERFREVRSELRALQRLATEQQLYTPELLEHMRQLQKLLEAMDPQKPEQLLSQLQQSIEDSLRMEQLKQELDRAYQEWQEKLSRLEALLPSYQQQRRLEEVMTRLAETAERQARLSEMPDSVQRQEGTQVLQQRLETETQSLRQAIDSLRQQTPSGPLQDSLGTASQHLQEALRFMERAMEQVRSGSSPQGAQKSAAESLERALNALDQGNQQEMAESESEEYEALRMLLKGILSLSFRQEAARKKAQESASFLSTAQPLVSEQNAIRRDYKQVQDSLYALAQRSPVIEEGILDLLRDMEVYFRALSYQQPELLLRRQQYILQGLNRLANLLTELLAQLEERQQNRQQAGGACQRPFRVRRKGGMGKPSPSPSSQGQMPTSRPFPQKKESAPSLRQLQQQLNESLQRALTPNPASEAPAGLSPEERARLSAQQELIRLRLQEQLRQHPGDAGQLQSLIEEMQKAEKEILGGAFTRERLLRQQEILTRLLDYERSQQERELDPARESRTAQQFFLRTTGVYPRPVISPSSAPPAPALWLYRPFYQQLIERYLQAP